MKRCLSAALTVMLVTALLVPVTIAAQEGSDTEAVARASTQFALDLYRHLNDGKSDNLFFSPYSIYTVLALLFGGARGATADQIAAALGVKEMEPEAFHSALIELREHLDEIEKAGTVELSVANSLWPQTGAALREEFLRLAGRYRAEMHPVDYRSDPQGVRKRIDG